jgi:hypothetical protein
MTPTVEPVVHQRALARLTTQPTASNYLKERAARQQCLIANNGVPCTCKLPVEEAEACKLDQEIKPTSGVGVISGLWGRLKAAV